MAKCPYCGVGIARYFLSRKCPKCGELLGKDAGVNQTLGSVSGAEDFIEKDSEKSAGDPGTVGTDELGGEAVGMSPASESRSKETVGRKIDPSTVIVGHTTGLRDDSNSTVQLDEPVSDERRTAEFAAAGEVGIQGHNATVDMVAMPIRDDVTVAFDPGNADGSGHTPDQADATVELPQNLDTSSSVFNSSQQSKLWNKQLDLSGSTPAGNITDKVADSFIGRLAKRHLVYEADGETGNSDYKVKHVLAEGGQGAVYVATQSCLGREVAVKFLKKAAANKGIDSSRLGRLINEAEITAALGHPNVLPIHELAITGTGEIFYSMKKVEGKDWSDALASNEATLEENVEFLLRVCDAIAFAHSKNVIHRDLKPENVMVGKFGEVLVADWGMAVDLNKLKDFRASSEQPYPFVPGGSIRYMSPEMAKHDWPRIDQLSDIYLLGAMLYQLVEKNYIRQAENSKKGIALARENYIEPPRSQSKLIPVAMKAMSFSPKDRYQSVEEFQDAIREVNRHAESERLEVQATATLAAAIEKSDSEKFNEAIFGFRNALELWPTNSTAGVGLKKARLAYASDALQRNNFDVCLEVLDPKNPDEKELYEKAAYGQRDVRSREKRYRLLKYGSLTGAAIAFVVLSGLLKVTYSKMVEANKANVEKQLALKEEQAAREQADIAREQAVIAREQADIAREQAVIQQFNASFEKDEADLSRQDAEKEKDKAVKAKKEALAAKDQEKTAKKDVKKKARQAEIGRYQSALVSAFSLNRSFNVRRSEELLEEIKDVQGKLKSLAAEENWDEKNERVTGYEYVEIPTLYNWASNRVATLNNQDLPRISLNESQVSCLDVSPDGRWGVVGTKEGAKSELVVLEYTPEGYRREIKRYSSDRDIVSVAISIDGREVSFLKRGNTGTALPTLCYWNLSEADPTSVPSTGNREFQWISFSPDGKRLCVGLKSGLWAWDRPGEKVDFSKERKFECSGDLLNIQFIPKDGEFTKAFCTVRKELKYSGGIRALFFYEVDFTLDPTKSAVSRFEMDSDLASVATCGAQVTENGTVMIGALDGRIYLAERIEEQVDGERKTKLRVKEELPKMQQAGVKAIRQDGFSKLAIVREDSAVELWEREKSIQGEQGGWRFQQSLLGLRSAAVDARFSKNGTFVTTVDRSGLCIDYDLNKQKIRTKIPSDQGIFSGILATGGTGVNGKVWAVDKFGLLHSWTPTQPEKTSRPTFAGHTPKAEFRDAAINEQARVLVTATRLGEESKNFREGEIRQEFCVWDLDSGNMLHRWYRNSDKYPKIACISEGKIVVVVDAESAEFHELDGKSIAKIPSSNNFAYVAVVANPKNPNQVALVNEISEVIIADPTQPRAFVTENKELGFTLRAQLMPPVAAAWAPDGNRFYVLRDKNDGQAKALAALDWDGKSLKKSVIEDALGLPGDGPNKFKPFAVNTSGLHRVDLIISQADGQERIRFAIREKRTGKDGASEDGSILGEAVAGQGLKTVEYRSGYGWLSEAGDFVEAKQFQERMGRKPRAISKILNADLNHLTLIEGNSDRSADAITEFLGWSQHGDRTSPEMSFGRTNCLLAFGDDAGQAWYTIHGRDGSYDLFEGKANADGEIKWTRFGSLVSRILGSQPPRNGSISSDGRYLAISSDAQSAIIDLQQYKAIHLWPDYQYASWKPFSTDIVLAKKDGTLKFASIGNLVGVEGKVTLEGGSEIAELGWHRENLLKQDEKITKWHLMVLEKQKDSKLTSLAFHEVDGNQLVNVQQAPVRIAPGANISAFTSSSLDGTIAVGTEVGEISLWFVSPTTDKTARELFSIDEHRGVKVSHLRFSKDGTTLHSGDLPASDGSSRGRAHGWLAIERKIEERIGNVSVLSK